MSTAVQPCPVKRSPIEIVFLGENGEAVSGILAELQRGGTALLCRTGSDGLARFDGLEPGSYHVAFPELDQDAWKLVREEAIPDRSSGDATWGAPADRTSTEVAHTVIPGDCLSSIGFQFGFTPDTIWHYGPNAELRAHRKSPHVLLAGDQVRVPALRERRHPVKTATRLVLVRVGIPEVLRVRFVTHGLKPRAGLPYLLEIETADGSPALSREGVTNGEGYLIEPIPPNAVSGRVLLGSGVDIEEHPIQLGHIDPVDEVRGIQGRLINLGYNCGELTGEWNQLTRAAVVLFQQEHNLPVTGEADAATKAKLETIHLS